MLVQHQPSALEQPGLEVAGEERVVREVATFPLRHSCSGTGTLRTSPASPSSRTSSPATSTAPRLARTVCADRGGPMQARHRRDEPRRAGPDAQQPGQAGQLQGTPHRPRALAAHHQMDSAPVALGVNSGQDGQPRAAEEAHALHVDDQLTDPPATESTPQASVQQRNGELIDLAHHLDDHPAGTLAGQRRNEQKFLRIPAVTSGNTVRHRAGTPVKLHDSGARATPFPSSRGTKEIGHPALHIVEWIDDPGRGTVVGTPATGNRRQDVLAGNRKPHSTPGRLRPLPRRIGAHRGRT